MNRVAAILVAALAGTAFAGELSTLKSFYGESSLSAITGNGSLTAGVDRDGQVIVCRWPSPAMQDQLGQTGGDSGPTGLAWGIALGGEVLWPGDAGWSVRTDYGGPDAGLPVTTARLAGTNLVATITTFVHPAADVLVSRIEIEGAESAPAIYWRADFTPTTRLVPELPVADWLFDGANDFAAAAFESRKSVFHFRPLHPGSHTWREAERLAGEHADLPDWASFGQGVWIGYASPYELHGYFAGTKDVPLEEAVAATSLSDGTRAAVGECYSLVRVAPRQTQGRYEAAIVVAFAENAKRASDLLEMFRGKDSSALAHEASQAARAVVDDAALAWAQDDALREDLRRCVSPVLISTDRRSGATARAISVRPPLARDWPRHGAWISYCLDLAGYGELVETRARFYASAARNEWRKGRPYGSLPAALYADGGDAAPHLVVDVDAVSLTLWSFYEHAQRLDPDRRRAFVASIWDGAARLADFLSTWRSSHAAEPVTTFDPAVWEDRPSRTAMIHARMGMGAAIALARTAGETVPAEWTRRHKELEVFVRNLCLDPALEWPPDAPLPFALLDLVPADDPRFSRATEARLNALERSTPYDTASALLDLALFWRDAPGRLRSLRPRVGPALRRVLYERGADGGLTPAFPDAAAAAKAYVAAWLIFNGESTK